MSGDEVRKTEGELSKEVEEHQASGGKHPHKEAE